MRLGTARRILSEAASALHGGRWAGPEHVLLPLLAGITLLAPPSGQAQTIFSSTLTAFDGYVAGARFSGCTNGPGFPDCSQQIPNSLTFEGTTYRVHHLYFQRQPGVQQILNVKFGPNLPSNLSQKAILYLDEHVYPLKNRDMVRRYLNVNPRPQWTNNQRVKVRLRIPAAPKNLRVTSSGGVPTVRWNAESNVPGYEVQYRRAGYAGSWSSTCGSPYAGLGCTTQVTPNPTGTSQEISDLDEGVMYEVRIRATGRTWTEPVQFSKSTGSAELSRQQEQDQRAAEQEYDRQERQEQRRQRSSRNSISGSAGASNMGGATYKTPATDPDGRSIETDFALNNCVATAFRTGASSYYRVDSVVVKFANGGTGSGQPTVSIRSLGQRVEHSSSRPYSTGAHYEYHDPSLLRYGESFSPASGSRSGGGSLTGSAGSGNRTYRASGITLHGNDTYFLTICNGGRSGVALATTFSGTAYAGKDGWSAENYAIVSNSANINGTISYDSVNNRYTINSSASWSIDGRVPKFTINGTASSASGQQRSSLNVNNSQVSNPSSLSVPSFSLLCLPVLERVRCPSR